MSQRDSGRILISECLKHTIFNSLRKRERQTSPHDKDCSSCGGRLDETTTPSRHLQSLDLAWTGLVRAEVAALCLLASIRLGELSSFVLMRVVSSAEVFGVQTATPKTFNRTCSSSWRRQQPWYPLCIRSFPFLPNVSTFAFCRCPDQFFSWT